ncbi:ATP-binding protein [Pelagicoccus mobilis]|uniref:histidine kinase n=1 Tax=Pelagicoccus mobilis TaxID=415221 RepID=A0A934RSZ8_9BACT|nr:ATP-binding protein [Pelagicoccus mobilis]MBK1875878.1 response regulator [Pelagicoccus mobilis]
MTISVWMRWWVVVGFVTVLGAKPFVPEIEVQIEDPWRWVEIEATAGFETRCTAEAPDGSVWLAGEEGLARYDGSTLERYSWGGQKVGGVKDVYVSKAGVVYCLTEHFAASFYAGEWTVLWEETSDDRSLETFCEDFEGAVWFGVNDRLIRCKGKDVTAFDSGFSQVGPTLVDTNGALWVAHDRSGEVRIFETNTNESGELRLLRSINVESARNTPTKMLLDSVGAVWVLNPDENDHCYRFVNYEKRFGVAGLRENGFAVRGTVVAEAPANQLWFLSPRRMAQLENGRLNLYELEDLSLPTSYPYMTQLSGGRLLLGGRTSNAFVVDLSSERWGDFKYLSFQHETDDQVRWFIHYDRRVISWDRKSDQWTAYGVEDGVIEYPNRVIVSSDGTVWASGSQNGEAAVSYFDGRSWRQESFSGVSTRFSHLGVLESTEGAILFGAGSEGSGAGSNKGGVVAFRKEDGRYGSSHLESPLFPYRSATIVEREDDGFWVGANFLAKVSGNRIFGEERFEQFERKWIDHLLVDQENQVWAALWGRGVYRYDGSDWDLFRKVDGLASDQVVYMLEGKRNEGVWAATAEGVCRYDGKGWSQPSFLKDLKLQREGGTLREGVDGSLWFTNSHRDWLMLREKNFAHKAEFRSVRYQADRAPPETKLLEYANGVPEGSPLVVTWEGSDSWSLTPKDEIEFSWRMNGQPWSAFSTKTSVAIPNMSSGNHVFEVRARDRDWNIDSTPAVVTLNVVPPVWKRGWFIVLVITSVGGFVFLLVALFKARVRAAIAMEEFKLDFFTNISHELRNPLSVIVGPLESLLEEEGKPEDKRGLLQLALRNARKMQGLVDQLLQFRKLDLGKARYRPESGEIVGFVKDAVMTEEPLWKRKGQSLALECDPPYWECTYDGDKLQKIVDNLLTNAVKYTPEGGAIRIGFNVSEFEGDHMGTLVVEDSGIGIPPHEIDAITKPFYRVRPELDKSGGFGIGLALVNQLVALWGGEISFNSPIHPGKKGTRVTVRLPLDRFSKDGGSVSELEHEAEEAEASSGASDEGQRRSSVLLVEDNEDLLLFMKSKLGEEFEILQAADGAEGFRVADEANPDLIITDVMMPEMDGFELCRKIKSESNTSHIPVIMLTAKSAEEHSVEGIEAGADAYFPKPVKLRQLKARVQNLLESRRQLRKLFAEKLAVEPTELTVTSADETILRKAIKVVEDNMRDSEFGVGEFASAMGMSRSTLNRKLKALVDQGPNIFIRSLRIKRAAQLLKSGKVTVSQTLEFVGILDLSYFSRIFKAEFGVPPSEFAARYKDSTGE